MYMHLCIKMPNFNYMGDNIRLGSMKLLEVFCYFASFPNIPYFLDYKLALNKRHTWLHTGG